jgi:flagellar hook-length control protein FliK
MNMATNTATVAGTKSCAPVAAAPSSTAASAAASGAVPGAAKGSAAPADFLAMLGQMLQGPATEAGEIAVELLDTGGGDSATEGDAPDELLDPALLADQVLAMAALSLPVLTPHAPAGAPAGAAAGVAAGAPGEGAAAVGKGRGGAILGLVADTASADADAVAATADGATPTRSDAPGAGATAVLSGAQQSAAQGGAMTTQLVTQNMAPEFATADAAPAPVTQRVVHSSVGSNAWANDLGARLTLMAGQGQHSASLRLSPEHLGPLEVRIDMSDDKASVWFGAQHADTRAALNEALPRLRELFAASGMMLTDAGVSQQPPRQEARDNAARLAQTLNRDSSQSALGASQTVTSVTNPGLLDLYA